MSILGYYNYLFSFIIMIIGLCTIISTSNLIKKLVGLSIFQTSVFLFYISIAKIDDGHIPLISEKSVAYINPLPHVLILTAIVVGVSTLAVALAVVIRIKRSYGSVEESEVSLLDQAEEEMNLEKQNREIQKDNFHTD